MKSEVTMKKIIRKEILTKRGLLTAKEVTDKSMAITQNIIESKIIKDDMNILVYMDFRNEVKTTYLIDYIIKHIGYVLLPRVDKASKELVIHKVESIDDLRKSNYGILEPKLDCEVIDCKAIDLILAPGVAFDRNFFRLGYGGGFYDKLLSKKRKEVPVIALAFDLQLIDSVPTEPHDFKMNGIITESTIIQQSL